MEYLSVSPKSLSRAADIIKRGGIAAFPTETVYGLGADAYNPAALVKIFEAKGRPRFDPLIIHIAGIKTLETVCDLSQLSEKTRKKLFLLCENFWPGPLSIVLPKSTKIPGIATAGLPTAAVRFPANEAAQTLISLAGGAVAAPSANPFGALSPTRAEHVRDTLGEKVDIILDGGPAAIGVESTVLDITGDKVRLLRYGGITREAIESVISEQLTVNSEQLTVNSEQGFTSPGQLKSHYAPRTPLTTFDAKDIAQMQRLQANGNAEDAENTAWLFFDENSRRQFQLNFNKEIRVNSCNPWTFVLSASGDVNEAAACLFETLHEMDKLGAKRIYAQLAPEQGLGMAINDRLRRAGA